MPATEKTWRDQAKMHVIFGISAIVMLVATMWMLAKDHNREWRKWQVQDRTREVWTTEAQLAQSVAESNVALTRLQKDLDESHTRGIERVAIEQFKTIVADEDKRLSTQTDTRGIEAANEKLTEAIQAYTDGKAEMEARAKSENR